MDITKLPIIEGVVGFLIVVIIITFVGAFSATGGGAEGGEVSPPPPDETAGPDETPPPDGNGDGPIEMVMQDNSFDPEDLTVKAGGPVTFNLTNEGSATHNMHIAGPDGDYSEDFCRGGGDPCSDPNSVGAGDSATLTWEVPASPGEVDFRCDFHPQDMTGTITVE
jgi:plastocyanin